MSKVLHYKTNFLNKSETFIHRLVSNHRQFESAALCYRKRDFTDKLEVFEAPKTGLDGLLNTASFHLNLPLPYYRKIIRQLKPDVIHAHFGYDAQKLVSISNSENIPLVVSFYGSDVSRLPSERGWKKRYKKLANDGSHFIAASEFMKNQLIALGFPKNKISVIYFGLDLGDLIYSEKSFDNLTIMMAGRLVEKKGFEYALKAIGMLSARGFEIAVSIFGDGPLLGKLKTLTVELGISHQVEFLGFCPVDEIIKAHDKHTLFLAPSVTAPDGDMEGLPNTILEAMAKGTPVVSTSHAAIPEAIDHGTSGFIVNEKDPAVISDIIENILKGMYDLKSISKNGRAVAEKKFNIKRMVQNVEEVYLNVRNSNR